MGATVNRRNGAGVGEGAGRGWEGSRLTKIHFVDWRKKDVGCCAGGGVRGRGEKGDAGRDRNTRRRKS
jgi:hypothetical protein